jgi:hypothetical protein
MGCVARRGGWAGEVRGRVGIRQGHLASLALLAFPAPLALLALLQMLVHQLRHFEHIDG